MIAESCLPAKGLRLSLSVNSKVLISFCTREIILTIHLATFGITHYPSLSLYQDLKDLTASRVRNTC
jgi:hypothetical protein